MRFVPSGVTNPEAPGADAEQKVFERLREAFSGDTNGIGFYKFPVTDRAGQRFDREPDFVILHKEYGLLIIEVKGYQIDHISDIIGQNWVLQGTEQSEAQPYSQARDQGFFIQSHFTREAELRDERGNSKVPMNPIVALPHITRDEWEAAGFDLNPSARVLLQDDLTPATLHDKLADLPDSGGLSDDVYRAARAILTGGEVVADDRGETKTNPKTKLDYYQHLSRGLKELDKEQKEIGFSVPPGPQQIRGIAGSGKTVLLAMKAAAMHVKNPDWNIALTFNTRSLYEEVETLVDRFVALFSDGTKNENIDIVHGWGGRKQEGLYYILAKKAGIEPYTVGTAEDQFGESDPNAALNRVAADLLERGDIPQYYDAILIDEGQDFEPAFYRMCYEALSDDRRLIWAYDEAQNLTNLTAPTPKQIFGDDQSPLPEKLDLSGSYEGDILRSRVMRRSYRAPRESLMIAHAMGMALKRPDLEVPRITRKEGWEDIGYQVEGDFRQSGDEIVLKRPPEFSPHPLQKRPEAGPYVDFTVFDERDAELEFVAESIASDIKDEELPPEEVLVIPLEDPNPAIELGKELRDYLADHDIAANFAWNGNANVFKQDGKVTISRIHRAKGNEAAQVYIVNLQAVERNTWFSDTVKNRNELFVALTRSRAWCTVTGSGESDNVFNELDAVIAEVQGSNPRVTFPVPPHRDIDISEAEALPSAGEPQAEIQDFLDTEDKSDGTAQNSISKVYLGAEIPIKSWVPLPSDIVTDKIVPLVKKNSVEETDTTGVYVNFSQDISISGWNEVDSDVVTEEILPIVKRNRIDK